MAETKYIERGDPVNPDWISTSFKYDGVWRVLDCRSIVPEGTTLIHFRGLIKATTAGMTLYLRKPGKDNDVDLASMVTQVANIQIGSDMWICCDANRAVQYMSTTKTPTGPTLLNLTIVGWMAGQTQELVI